MNSQDALARSEEMAREAPEAETGFLVFWYRNYRGEEGYRHVRPVSIRFGSSEYHKEPQWLLLADDTVNGKRREFAMKDISSVVGAPTIWIHGVVN